MSRKLDSEKKGLILFPVLMTFLTNNCRLSEFNDINKEYKTIGKNLNNMMHSMKTFLQKSASLQPGEKIVIPTFLSVMKNLLPDRKISDLYWLYYNMAGMISVLQVNNLINLSMN